MYPLPPDMGRVRGLVLTKFATPLYRRSSARTFNKYWFGNKASQAVTTARPDRSGPVDCEDRVGTTQLEAVQEPKYWHLKTVLNEALDSEFAVGEILPNERDLAARFGVARATLRQALEQLELEGRLQRRRGVGTTVAPPRIGVPVGPSADGWPGAGRDAWNTVGCVEAAAPAPVAALLGTGADGSRAHRPPRADRPRPAGRHRAALRAARLGAASCPAMLTPATHAARGAARTARAGAGGPGPVRRAGLGPRRGRQAARPAARRARTGRHHPLLRRGPGRPPPPSRPTAPTPAG